MKRLISVVLSLTALAASPLFAADGPDALWEVTMKMDMPGMPAMMNAPMTHQVCVEKNNQEKAVPMEKDCQMVDMKRSGLTTSYRFKCSGKNEMTGSGQITYAADGNSYKGNMEAKGNMDGRPFQMKQDYTAKRVGNCSAGEQKKQVQEMQARTQQSVNEMCTPTADTYNLPWQIYEPNQVCAKYRPALCKRAKEIANEIATDPVRYVDLKPSQDRWGEAMSKCGIDPDKIAPPCKQAVAKKNWQFVTKYCPAETKTIGAKECSGRDYTAMMESEYAPICVSFAKKNVGNNEPEPKAKKTKEQSKDATDTAKDVMKNEAVDKLKGMFHF